ncbi:unnamed protein product [Rotaria magnacalcarata]|uniref:Uncharacterized protein n=1 Tax=Rotaria magnacalcarata TaxID=392030 RepID=A0A816FI32_9BILA|nr:unnamed protein product [Rotaria magnacalcarata]CAF3788890.1 unnamed protein product [Rotaria magnacalcarata]
MIKDGNQVIIIGGGYGTCSIVLGVAKDLGINPANVFSGISSFDKNDNFVVTPDKIGFFNCVTGEKITNNFIKSEVISYLKKKEIIKGKVIHVGDGENDLEVWNSGQADLFIGFGVNKTNKKVKDYAPVFVKTVFNFNEYIDQNI